MTNVLPGGNPLASFPFIFAFFFSDTFRFSHEQQKLEDIGGGFLMHGYAVDHY